MKIGSVAVDNRIFLAPMAGVTDLPFRLLCKAQGAGLVYTEMVSAKALHYQDKRTFELLAVHDDEQPVAVQIFGSEPEVMAGIAKKAVSTGACIIDINMGCPTPKIVKNGEGSALMLKPDLVKAIIYAVSNAVDLPVTVKFRKGWDDDHLNAVEIAKIAEQNGAKAVTVHGRTREQYYSGKADWDVIKAVKQAVRIPVIGNGDIFEPEHALAMMAHTACDAVMIARGAEGNPWIFARTLALLNGLPVPPPPTHAEKIDMALKHLVLLVQYKGEVHGIREGRKHMGWYLKGLHGAARVKETVNKLTTYQEVLDALTMFRDNA